MTETEAWLALARAPAMGAGVAEALLARYGSPGAVVGAGAKALRAAGATPAVARAIAEPDEAGIARDLAWLEADSAHHLIPLRDPRYPPLLREIPDPPVCLFVTGDPDVLTVPQLAVVGSRNATPGGLDTAAAFCAHLAGRGLTITSGLALGVDAAAHQGALDGGGFTVAVVATGPDRVYPSRHRDLAHAVAGSGAVVSEYACGTPARAGHFPRRNRIISGLSVGTLVVEASPRSGSLITARYALEQGREVFAIPGSIHNPLARGCHRLIRDGAAKLIEQADEILEELPALLRQPEPVGAGVPDAPEAPSAGLDPEHEKVLEAVGYDPVPLDTVLQRTGLTPDVVSSILLILELSGRVTAMPGGRYVRAGRD
ncbi:DNA-processing protein DprA [Aquisalimonas asiatica]|uniref:DNA protecting protein DprA n=1 Tax=Aquisalimonas asiatica TaxID=406100 RepID=A0A1H8TCJ6_9GAMM|nr:DNA-processing protein DprA [Aquisalimonas asiatica]SEO88466.1 DNA protecting protein DprA [Aquisalimonas asiatica]